MTSGDAVTDRPWSGETTCPTPLPDETPFALALEREAASPVLLDDPANRYESALNRIANLGMDAPTYGPEPEDFYRDQLMMALAIAARALTEKPS